MPRIGGKMGSLNGRLNRLEQQIAQQPDPENIELARELIELDRYLLALSRADKMVWLDEQLARLEEDSGWLELLADWKEFLTLKAGDTAPGWDAERRRCVDTPNSKRWSELSKRWGWAGRWTGAGLPPQLIPGCTEYLF